VVAVPDVLVEEVEDLAAVAALPGRDVRREPAGDPASVEIS